MIIKYSVAAAVLIGAVTPAPAQSVSAGIEAWQSGNYPSAVGIWRPLAEKGDADAQFNLGQAYRLGRGVAIDLALAKSWLEKAAAQGHVDAETTLGLLLFQNGEQAAALKWLKLAAEASEPRAMLVYGTALFNGDTVTQDPIAGYAYVYRANASGLPAARDVMAQLDRLVNDADKQKAFALVKVQDKAAGRALFSPGRRPNAAAAGSAKPEKASPPRKMARPTKVAEADIPPPPAGKGPEPVAKPVKQASRKPVAAKPGPKSPPAEAGTAAPAEAGTAAPASGGWRIQVGAFANRASAEAAFRKLGGNGALAGRGPQYLPFQQFIRLRIGPFSSRASAAAACSAVKVPCYPVAPGK